MISLNTMKTGSAVLAGSRGRPHSVFEVASGNLSGAPLVTRRAGERFREGSLSAALKALPKGGVLYLDTRGVEFMDYSFADEAIGTLVSRVARGEYGERHLVLVEDDRDLLENVEVSLRQRDLAMTRVAEVGDEAVVLGNLDAHLLETLEAIGKSGPITNAELAKKLEVNHTACNNRTNDLFDLGLVARSKETGGRRYVYERIS